jgi:hypothetical protein
MRRVSAAGLEHETLTKIMQWVATPELGEAWQTGHSSSRLIPAKANYINIFCGL